MQISVKSGVMAVALASVLVAQAASAADTVRVIDSTRGPYGNFALYQARDEGYYKKENLDVSTIFGSGGSATLQAIITGSAARRCNPGLADAPVWDSATPNCSCDNPAGAPSCPAIPITI